MKIIRHIAPRHAPGAARRSASNSARMPSSCPRDASSEGVEVTAAVDFDAATLRSRGFASAPSALPPPRALAAAPRAYATPPAAPRCTRQHAAPASRCRGCTASRSAAMLAPRSTPHAHSHALAPADAAAAERRSSPAVTGHVADGRRGAARATRRRRRGHARSQRLQRRPPLARGDARHYLPAHAADRRRAPFAHILAADAARRHPLRCAAAAGYSRRRARLERMPRSCRRLRGRRRHDRRVRPRRGDPRGDADPAGLATSVKAAFAEFQASRRARAPPATP